MSLVSRLLSTQCHVQSSKSMKRPRDSWSFLSEISILIENSSVRFTSFISHKISYIHRNHLMHFLALCNMSIKFLSHPQIHHLVNDLHCRQTSSSKGWPNPTSKCMIKEIFNKKDYRPPCKQMWNSIQQDMHWIVILSVGVSVWFWILADWVKGIKE